MPGGVVGDGGLGLWSCVWLIVVVGARVVVLLWLRDYGWFMVASSQVLGVVVVILVVVGVVGVVGVIGGVGVVGVIGEIVEVS